MNNLFFACEHCKEYIDAGYRWAYFTLVRSGHVDRDERVDSDRVLQTEQYWNPPIDEQSQWLHQLLPEVKRFLIKHQNHTIQFGDFIDLFDNDDGFDWLDLSPDIPELSPRYFIEVLEIYSWEDVIEYIQQMPRQPWWFYADLKNAHPEVVRCFYGARDAFERLVAARRQA